jgi:hypothetical protein
MALKMLQSGKEPLAVMALEPFGLLWGRLQVQIFVLVLVLAFDLPVNTINALFQHGVKGQSMCGKAGVGVLVRIQQLFPEYGVRAETN